MHSVDEQPLDRLINHYCSYYRLKKAVARLLRIVNYFKRNKDNCNINDPVTGRVFSQISKKNKRLKTQNLLDPRLKLCLLKAVLFRNNSAILTLEFK